MCKVGDINLSYESLTSPGVRQAIVGLRKTDSALYEQLSIPPPSVPVPPPPPESDGLYPEDKEHEDGEVSVDSSLSIDEVVAQIADDVPLEVVDSSEDEGIVGFCHSDSRGPADALGLFNEQSATSSWMRWDGVA